MKKLKKIFTTENIKVFFAFMIGSMLITLGFALFLMTYFDYVTISTEISVGKFWWHVTGVAIIYSLVMYGILQILFLFDKNR